MCNMCPIGPDVNVWFTCKPCRNYFVKVQDFIQHKQKFHFQDFHQFITFEEATDWDPNLSLLSTLPMIEDDPDLTCGSTTRPHDLYLDFDSLGLLFWFACKLCDSFFLNADDLVEHGTKTHNNKFNENQKKTGFIILEERTDINQNNNWFSLTSPKETIEKNTQDNFLISQPSTLPQSSESNCNLSIKSSSIINLDTSTLTTPCHQTQADNFYLPSLVQFDNHPRSHPNDNNLLVIHPGPGSTLLHFPGVGSGNSDNDPHKPPVPSPTRSQHTEIVPVSVSENVSGISSTQLSSTSVSDILRTRLTLEQTQIHPTINPNSIFIPKPKQQNEFQDQVKVQAEETNNNISRSSKIFKCLHTTQFQIPNNVHNYQERNSESPIELEIGSHTSSKSRSNNNQNDHFDYYMGAHAELLPVPIPVPIPIPIPVVPTLSDESVTTETESTIDPLLDRQPNQNQLMSINSGNIEIKNENEIQTTQLKENTISQFPDLLKNKYGGQLQQESSDQNVGHGHATTLIPAQTHNVIQSRSRGHQRKYRKRNKPSKHEIRSGDSSSSDLNHYYKCRYPTCKKRFKTNLALQNHSFYHTVDPHRIFPCPRQNCNLTFTSETDLFDHLPAHTPEVKFFFCLHLNCGKSFRYNYQLKEHFKNTHYWSPTQTTGPFRCPRPALQHCRDLLFKTQWHLKVHLENSSVHNCNNSNKNKKPPTKRMDQNQNQNQLKITDKSKPTDSRSISNLDSVIRTVPKPELPAFAVAVAVSKVDGSKADGNKMTDTADRTDPDADLQGKQLEKIEGTDSSSNSIIPRVNSQTISSL